MSLVRGITFVVLMVLLSACDFSADFGLPSTRALESGAADGLGGSRSFEITGPYSESRTQWKVDLQVAGAGLEHISVTGEQFKMEAIIIGPDAYFRGRAFLSAHLGTDPGSVSLAKAAGESWWKGSAQQAPNLADFTDGSRLKSTFLGSVVTARTDHQSVDGVAAVEFSSPRADVYIAEAEPHRLLRVHMRDGAHVDGIAAADFRFSNFDRDFGITAPPAVIDFSDLSTLPPSYSVVSIDTSGCGSPCVVVAQVRNLGGRTGARAPSTITFTMTETATGKVLGTCGTQVVPDVRYNVSVNVACTVRGSSVGQDYNSATVTAVADNPGHA